MTDRLVRQPALRKLTNRDVVFQLLRTLRQTTRTDLARRSGLSKATMTEVVDGLLAEGFVREAGKRALARGRSQVVLEFVPETRLVLGAHLLDQTCTVVLTDLYAQPRARAIRQLAGTTPDDFVAAICAAAEELRAQAGAPILGLGVGAPGSVDPRGREVTISVPYGWKNVPLADRLEARLGLPVILANRAKVAALGEVWQGEHAAIDPLVYVYVGSGIVAGIVIGGRLYFGASGAAGELGHVTILPDGPLCGCGNTGCLHTLVSEEALLRRVRAKLRASDGSSDLTSHTAGHLGQLTLGVVRTAAQQGDLLVLEALAETGAYLGLALANLVNLINPRMVVLGGPIPDIGEAFLEPVRREVRRRALWDVLADLAIVPSALGDEAGPIGAAALLLDRLAAIGADGHLPAEQAAGREAGA
ncbi:MAG: ROK family transcriptional regulator [Thermomicrobiales bacterium]